MKTLALIATGLTLAATPVLSQGLSDHYVFGFGGVVFDGSVDSDGIINGGPESVDVDLDTGFNIGVGVGASIGNNFRVEGELSYSDEDVDGVAFSGNGPAAEINVSGDVRTVALFANGYYDFVNTSQFTPYVGVGLGLARVDQDFVYGPGVRVDDSDTVFATQLIAGASYDLGDGFALTGDVRYRRFYDIEADRLAPTGANTGGIEGDLDSFAVNVGVRFSF